MSYEELDRVSVIERLIEKRLTQREAARMLGLTSRQVRRLRRAYARDGAVGLASKHRGRPSNRRLASELRREALAIVRSRYEGFGPTLAHEKLTELQGLQLSVETLRPEIRSLRSGFARAPLPKPRETAGISLLTLTSGAVCSESTVLRRSSTERRESICMTPRGGASSTSLADRWGSRGKPTVVGHTQGDIEIRPVLMVRCLGARSGALAARPLSAARRETDRTRGWSGPSSRGENGPGRENAQRRLRRKDCRPSRAIPLASMVNWPGSGRKVSSIA
jgi:hypothetical protein